MREIKFRAWCNDQKRMFTKVLIGNTTNPDSDDYTAHCIFRGGNWYNSDEHDSVVFMQYTGLKDKNGVEIWQKDICKVEGVGNALVDICPYYGVIFRSGEYEYPIVYCISENDKYEVIGNIYENPELLEE